MSSGVFVASADQFRYCGASTELYEQCMFEGEVEVFYDRETAEGWWDCPLCGYDHLEDLSYDGYDDEPESWYED